MQSVWRFTLSSLGHLLLAMTQARLSSILFLAVAALFWGCSGEEDAAQGPSISVSPRAVNLGVGLQQRFTATVEGLDDTSVRWVVVEGDGAGTIDASGLYTAPSTVGTYHVVAISMGDPSRSSSAVINVQNAASPVSVSLSPERTQIHVAGTVRFTATVVGTANTAVTWSVTEGNGGTIDATGLYTAPTAGGTFHVVATSVAAPDKKATATVVVEPELVPVSVSITPDEVDLRTGGTQTFTATVTGTANTAVSWSVTEAGGGTIDASGLYTAPSTPGTYHVVAASVAEPSRSATATVRVTAADTVGVTVAPTEVELGTGETKDFTATVTGTADTAVTWSVTGGTIDTAGHYTAPATAGAFQVVATSVADPSKSASATVRVRPFSTAGLVMHFSAADLRGLGGTLPAAGAPVASWVDLSGNGRDLTQTDATRQPVFNPNALNGLPTVSFDGSNTSGDFLRTAALSPALAQPVTIFFVYKAPPVSVNKTLLDAPPGTGANRARIQATPVPTGALQLYATKFSSPFKQKTPGTFYSVTAVFNGAGSRLRANGVEEAPSSSADPGTTGMAGLMLGGRQELNADAFAATEFAEVLVFDRALDAAELGRVEAYLKSLYFPP
ncbi:LamG-like jellyroll fold domain-containing protein [Stigmatella erecta]|uniref:BIG2 domain-containing protein n=1 Tax=Stigmatella erecta TaxID=83460 RepID=A0A1I0L3L9_9BACT|nr:LamG-like jellyroll fold domain-containing protein [Stigmatella erecta]SEU33994.1 hypothetical protein SAMN05443639_11818 [Stigmatella erecta]